jgi:hypothetical protein
MVALGAEHAAVMRRTFFGLVHMRQSQSRFEDEKIAILVLSS